MSVFAHVCVCECGFIPLSYDGCPWDFPRCCGWSCRDVLVFCCPTAFHLTVSLLSATRLYVFVVVVLCFVFFVKLRWLHGKLQRSGGGENGQWLVRSAGKVARVYWHTFNRDGFRFATGRDCASRTCSMHDGCPIGAYWPGPVQPCERLVVRHGFGTPCSSSAPI